jgi:hypothetical protein
MPKNLLELGATQLLELGSANLLELGATNLLELGENSLFTGSTPVPEAIVHIYDFVNTFEDPLAATGIKDHDLAPDELDLVRRIRQVNRRINNSLSSSVQLGSIDGYDDVLGMMLELGKKKGFFKRAVKAVEKAHKVVFKKIAKVVKSPAFLSVAGLIVNVIPGVGQIASAGLMAAAAGRKVYEQKVEQKKAVKKVNQANAAAAAAYLAQIKDYNAKTQAYYNSSGAMIPPGSLLDANGNATDNPANAPGITYPINIGGVTYQGPPGAAPVATSPPTQQQIAQAAAIAPALALSNGQNAGDANQLLQTLDPQMAQQAAAEVPEIQKYVSDPTFKPTSLAAIGQFVAMSDLDTAMGANIMSPQMHALAEQVKANASPDVQKAIEAGKQALVTSAALDGPDVLKAVQNALYPSSGPSLGTILLIAGGLAVAGGGVYALTRKG